MQEVSKDRRQPLEKRRLIITEYNDQNLEKMNSHPDKWFRREVEPLYREATKVAAEFVGCDSQDLVFVQNVTTGLNLAYVEFNIPMENEDQVVERYREAIKVHRNIKMVVIGNLHKWVFTPRGCAFLYINRKYHDWIKPLVTSHNYQRGPYWEFGYQGTRDDTPYTVVPKAVEFYNKMGGLSRIREYNSSLLDKAVEMLCSSFDLRRFPIPKSMEAPYMRLLILPKVPGYGTTEVSIERSFPPRSF
ncbi:hypothetical protein FSP39_009531 [Pinctada imbricata]|uniref:Uncharacterized protein n=1 Tax=Pinctada imbricata TaxID=66713 RepID=A0AA88XNS1_PINIB|nr:hypothetical protein FSP39_009531 [Pinctada imbricata]